MTAALAVLYAACVVIAAVTAPALPVVLTYGVTTWLGGCLFVLVVQRLPRPTFTRRRPRRAP